MKPFISIITILLVLSPFYSSALDDWSATGHRVVGKIASQYLKSSTKRKINKLLNNQSLDFVSTYADEIKSDKRFNEFYT
jgi:hypothetical protein